MLIMFGRLTEIIVESPSHSFKHLQAEKKNDYVFTTHYTNWPCHKRGDIGLFLCHSHIELRLRLGLS